MKPEDLQTEQELAAIMAQIPEGPGIHRNAEWQGRLRLAATKTQSPQVRALIKERINAAESVKYVMDEVDRENARHAEMLAHPPPVAAPVPPVDPQVTRQADQVQYGGCADPRASQEVDQLLQTIPPDMRQSVGWSEDLARRLQKALGQATSPTLRAEILRRRGLLLHFIPKALVEDQAQRMNDALSGQTSAELRTELVRRLKDLTSFRDPWLLEGEARKLREALAQATSAEMRAELSQRLDDLKPFIAEPLGVELLRGLGALGAGVATFLGGIALIRLFLWLEIASLKGIVLVLGCLVLGPLLALVGALTVVMVFLKRQMYLASAAAFVAMAGLFYSGWLVYQHFQK